ncbi:AsmA family protein [Hyphobacterium marinum]|uniref:AsmA family protein n=1 Tax=Hyphobacterium marinum TaxID=3116574 RepID=A0ABU7LWA8_9PROT|nr:AsmA family protein [Hyphobacterium sp. Y6023]MEE2565809.1 AsmA family protein [Hyphobacterium sp. Y6023]
MTRRAAKPLLIAAAILAGVSVLTLITLFAVAIYLSDPERATPFIRAQIDQRTESAVTLEAGWISPGWRPVLHLRNLELEERGRAEVLDAQLNPVGWMFGSRIVPAVHITNAAWTIRRGTGGRGVPSILTHVARADLTQVRLDVIHPSRPASVVVIEQAEGDLRSGDFTLWATGGQARITVTGQADGLSLAGFDGELELAGENFADFADLMGLAAADTPPYALTGRLLRDGEVWRLDPFDGTVGDSDLAGWMEADFSAERPMLRADLVSQSLDFDDLGVIIGAPSDVASGTENDRQADANAAYAASARLIPDAKLDFDRIRAADAEVRFRAESVQAGPLPLDELAFSLTLDRSVLTLDPVIFRTPLGGRLRATLQIDATRDPVESHLEGMLENFDMRDIAGGALARGRLASRFDLRLRSSSLRAAFRLSNGEIILTTSADSQLRHLAVEGSALDLGEVLLLIFTEEADDPDFIPINCAVARISVEEGIARADPILLDTPDSLIRMNGTISLHDEIIDLGVETDAKDVSWGNLLGGVQIGGTLRDPAVNINATASLLQGGVAALLSGVAGPLGAIPFADLGVGENAPCQSLAGPGEGPSEGG